MNQAKRELPTGVQQIGCGRHELYREGDVFRCRNDGCRFRRYPGQLFYAELEQYFELTAEAEAR